MSDEAQRLTTSSESDHETREITCFALDNFVDEYGELALPDPADFVESVAESIAPATSDFALRAKAEDVYDMLGALEEGDPSVVQDALCL